MYSISSNSLFIGKVASYLPKVDSTNTYAKMCLAKSTPIEGTVIYTDHQYAGRGQIGSKWESQPGENLILSVILYPKFLLATQQFTLNQVTALAVYDTIRQIVPSLQGLSVKWPNDLYLNDQKIGGLLIENQLQGAFLSHSVIGLGLNINQVVFDPALPNPTSLRLYTNETHDLEHFRAVFCEQLEQRYLQLKAQQFTTIKLDYLKALYRYQTWHLFQMMGSSSIFQAKILGVDDMGQLQLQTKEELLVVGFKEVVFVQTV